MPHTSHTPGPWESENGGKGYVAFEINSAGDKWGAVAVVESDRKHNAWDKAKAAIAKAKGTP